MRVKRFRYLSFEIRIGRHYASLYEMKMGNKTPTLIAHKKNIVDCVDLIFQRNKIPAADQSTHLRNILEAVNNQLVVN